MSATMPSTGISSSHLGSPCTHSFIGCRGYECLSKLGRPKNHTLQMGVSVGWLGDGARRMGNRHPTELCPGAMGLRPSVESDTGNRRSARAGQFSRSSFIAAGVATAQWPGDGNARTRWASTLPAVGHWGCGGPAVRHRNSPTGIGRVTTGTLPAMTFVLSMILFIAANNPAAAHGDVSEAFGVMTWTYDPWIMVPLYATALLYLVGTSRIWRHAGHGRGVQHWQAACFWSGWTVLALALLSPLHWLGEHLFVAHMVEHELLMVAAAPLLAIARPTAAMLWALPQAWRRTVGWWMRTDAIAAPWRLLRVALVATLLHTITVWAWHMPQLYNQVLTNIAMH